VKLLALLLLLLAFTGCS